MRIGLQIISRLQHTIFYDLADKFMHLFWVLFWIIELCDTLTFFFAHRTTLYTIICTIRKRKNRDSKTEVAII